MENMPEKKGQNEFVSVEGSRVKIKVIKDLCISAATCIIKAPDTFDLDEDGIAYVMEGNLDDDNTIIEGAMACPTNAIIIEDMEGNRIYPKEE
jgi:ferredoxin